MYANRQNVFSLQSDQYLLTLSQFVYFEVQPVVRVWRVPFVEIRIFYYIFFSVFPPQLAVFTSAFIFFRYTEWCFIAKKALSRSKQNKIHIISACAVFLLIPVQCTWLTLFLFFFLFFGHLWHRRRKCKEHKIVKRVRSKRPAVPHVFVPYFYPFWAQVA